MKEHLFEDNERLIADLIKDNWDLGIGNEPVIGYKRDMYMMNSRIGSIYVYSLGRRQTISSVDYRSLERHAQVAIRIANPDRDRHYQWCNEVYTILMRFRRAGTQVLNGYEYLEVTDDSSMNDLLGMYVTTLQVRLTGFAHPIHSSGFGVDDMGNEIGPRPDNL